MNSMRTDSLYTSHTIWERDGLSINNMDALMNHGGFGGGMLVFAIWMLVLAILLWQVFSPRVRDHQVKFGAIVFIYLGNAFAGSLVAGSAFGLWSYYRAPFLWNLTCVLRDYLSPLAFL